MNQGLILRLVWVPLLLLPIGWIHPAEPDGARWGGTAMIGLTSWNGLSELETPGEGGFDSNGWMIAGSVHRHLTRWGAADVLLGADLGIFATDSDITGISETLTQRGLYLTPSVKLRFGDRQSNYLTVQAGLGWYEIDFAELDCDERPCAEIADSFNRDTLGGYVGVGAGFAGWMFVNFNIHYSDFRKTNGYFDQDGLEGPIFMLAIGGAFGS